MSISPGVLASRFPRLYHMAEEGSWPSIKQHGLLSTCALLDLFCITGRTRVRIEESHRAESVVIKHPIHGEATIRDQKPMSDNGLLRCLEAGITPSLWYKTLNKKVFFWLTRERLSRLLNARAYREKCHCILTIDTAKLLQRYASMITLSPINSGCTKPYPQSRGMDTFLPLGRYPYEYWNRKRRGRDPIVELAIHYSVTDICSVVVRVEEAHGSAIGKVIWEPENSSIRANK